MNHRSRAFNLHSCTRYNEDSSAPLQLGSHLLVENAPFAECVPPCLCPQHANVCEPPRARSRVFIDFDFAVSPAEIQRQRMAHSNFNKIHYETLFGRKMGNKNARGGLAG